MKKFKFLFVAAALALVGNVAVAQSEEEVSNEDLRRYALMMEVVDVMKKEISAVTNEMIKNQEGMDGKRYMELAKAKGDDAKYAEMGAKDYEKQFMEVVTNMQEERKAAINDVVKILATKMLPDGGKTYNAVKKGLESDESLQARYEEIKSDIEKAEGA